MGDEDEYDGASAGWATVGAREPTPELQICRALVTSGLADGAGVSLMLDRGDRVELAATDETLRMAAEAEFTFWEGPGPEVIEHGAPVAVADMWAQAERWPLTAERTARLPLRGLVVFPLTVHGQAAGLVAAYWRDARELAPAAVGELGSVAAALGVVTGQRFTDGDITAPVSPVAPAMGMVMGALGVAERDALALLRARALVEDSTVPELAREIMRGQLKVTDLA